MSLKFHLYVNKQNFICLVVQHHDMCHYFREKKGECHVDRSFQPCSNVCIGYIYSLAKRRTFTCPSFRTFYCANVWKLWTMFFYEILILIKSKNINIFCFQIITNQTNLVYLFNETNNITKNIHNLNSYFF